MEGLITLSAKEWDRAKIIQWVIEEGGAQAEAAECLGVSLRHFRRIGTRGGRHGFPKVWPSSSRKVSDSVRGQALHWCVDALRGFRVHRVNSSDFCIKSPASQAQLKRTSDLYLIKSA